MMIRLLGSAPVTRALCNRNNMRAERTENICIRVHFAMQLMRAEGRSADKRDR